MKLFLRFVRLMSGIFMLSVGVVFTIKANLGLSPWDIFHDGISKNTPLSFGAVNIVTGVVLVIFVVMAGEKIGIGTIINTLSIGVIIDFLLWLNILPVAKGYFDGILFVLLGLFLSSLGTYLYISAGMGAGPRDGIMVYLVKRTLKSVSICRILMEGSVAAIGIVLGGKIGLGTVMAVFLSGPILQFVFFLFKFNVATLKQESIYDTISAVRKTDENAR